MKNKNNIKANQKSFFFDDYSDSEIIFDKKNQSLVKVLPNRITFLFFIFFSLILIFSIKIIYLSLFPNKGLFSKKIVQNFVNERADVTDRNGVVLARNIDVYSAGIRPKLVKDKKKLIIQLKLNFPELNIDKIKEGLYNDKFFYIKKRLTKDEKNRLWIMGNKAIVFEKKQIRIYPQKNLFSHVLGQIDDNNNGISGLEKFFDQQLKDKKTVKFPLMLTLDSNLQHLIREELINAKLNFNVKGSAALLMDVDDGEILSLISLPDYDLNKRNSIDDNIYTNKITKGVYELGSVFKTFTLAAALENNLVKPNTVFKDLKNKVLCAGRVIS